MPSPLNNPAARLLLIVTQAKAIPGNVSMRDGWARLFGVEPANLPAVFAGIANLITLTNETRREIENLEGYEKTLYMAPIDKLQGVFFTARFDVEWAQMSNQLDELTIYGLKIASDILSIHSHEQAIEDETISALLVDVADLLDAVQNGELPPDLKHFLVEQLERMRSAVLNYKMFGLKHLRAALESVTGAIFLRGAEIFPHKDEPIMQRMWALMSKISVLVTMAQGFQLLLGGINQFLGK